MVTLSGEDHYLGPYGSPASRVSYDRLLTEWLANRRHPVPSPDDRIASISIGQLLDADEEHAGRYYVKAGRPTTEPDNIRQALRPVRELYANVDARDFGPLALKVVRQAMLDRDWCRTFINRQVNRIKRMFARAAEEELVPIETYQALATVAGLRRGRTEAREKPPVRPVPDELVERVLAHLPVGLREEAALVVRRAVAAPAVLQVEQQHGVLRPGAEEIQLGRRELGAKVHIGMVRVVVELEVIDDRDGRVELGQEQSRAEPAVADDQVGPQVRVGPARFVDPVGMPHGVLEAAAAVMRRLVRTAPGRIGELADAVDHAGRGLRDEGA